MNKILSLIKDFPQDFIFSEYQWEYKELIGEGTFGKIFKVRNKNQNKFDAIKQLTMSYFDEQYKIQALKNQIETMKNIRCQNVVEIKDHYFGKTFTYILLQLCDTDLRKLLNQNKGKISEQMCCQIYSQLSKGFQKMVKRQYIHRDIKPENILIKNNIYKIAVFGFTRKLNSKKKQETSEVCGTPLYMAPQLLFNQPYTQKCDIWSMGLMLYQLLFGFNPWPTKHPDVYKNSIQTKPIAIPYDSKIGKNTYDFLKRSLQVQESKRLSWQEFFQHPFIRQKNIGKLLELPKVSIKHQRILKGFQKSILRRNINVLNGFQKCSKKYLYKSLQKNKFLQFLKEMDPCITTYQAQELFVLADKDNDKRISLRQFFQTICQIDYRPSDDFSCRKIQQIVVLAQTQNISMVQLFSKFDKNQSNTIDRNQFWTFINTISPQINQFQVEQIWARFDSNNSGHIEKDQFVAEMTRNCQPEVSQAIERAKRNICCLSTYLKQQKRSLKGFFSRTDLNKDKKISISQFESIMQSINYQITRQQVFDMFRLFDMDKNQFLDVQELEDKILRYSHAYR